MKKLILLAALGLSACGGNGDNDRPRTIPAPNRYSWQISYSVGVPTGFNEGFNFPIYPGHVNYITKPINGLTGKSSIYIRYRIEADNGIVLKPKCCPDLPSIGPTLYFQRRGDDMNTDGWRWWATFSSPMPITPGTYEITASLNDNWTSVYSMTAKNNPQQFRLALDNASQVGFTFGGGDGYGHGVYATGPARFVLEEFRID